MVTQSAHGKLKRGFFKKKKNFFGLHDQQSEKRWRDETKKLKVGREDNKLLLGSELMSIERTRRESAA